MDTRNTPQTPEKLRERLNLLHRGVAPQSGLNWEEISLLPEFYPVPAGTLCSFANGSIDMPKKWRRMFGVTRKYRRWQEISVELQEIGIGTQTGTTVHGAGMSPWWAMLKGVYVVSDGERIAVDLIAWGDSPAEAVRGCYARLDDRIKDRVNI